MMYRPSSCTRSAATASLGRRRGPAEAASWRTSASGIERLLDRGHRQAMRGEQLLVRAVDMHELVLERERRDLATRTAFVGERLHHLAEAAVRHHFLEDDHSRVAIQYF